MNPEILLIEDDDSLNLSVSLKLEKEGYTVQSAFSIKEAESLYRTCNISLIICDISLPDGNGLEFCSRIRKESRVLFLFLTALDTEENIIAGYARGADDYITKPFSLNVLVSKVNALTKRFPKENPDSIVSGDITLPISNKNTFSQKDSAQEAVLLTFQDWPCGSKGEMAVN